MRCDMNVNIMQINTRCILPCEKIHMTEWLQNILNLQPRWYDLDGMRLEILKIVLHIAI